MDTKPSDGGGAGAAVAAGERRGLTARPSRRQLLKMIGAVAAGGAATVVLQQTGTAEAAAGNPLILGEANDTNGSSTYTGLTSDHAVRTLEVGNTGDGAALHATASGLFAPGISAWSLNASAIDARTGGPNPAIFTFNAGAGVFAQSLAQNAVHGVTYGAFAGVLGDGLIEGVGTWGQSGENAGAVGLSTKGAGVFGRSYDSLGTAGQSKQGVGLHGLSEDMTGVVGISATGRGIHGLGGVPGVEVTDPSDPPAPPADPPPPPDVPGLPSATPESQRASGVVGQSATGVGVHGVSQQRAGVVGDSTDGAGVFGHSQNGPGVVAQSAAAWALDVQGTSRFATVGSGLIAVGQDRVQINDARVTGGSHVTVTLITDPGSITVPQGNGGSDHDDDDDEWDEHGPPATIQTGGTIIVGATFDTKTVTDVDVRLASPGATFLLTYNPAQDEFKLTSSLGPSQTVKKQNINGGVITLNFSNLKVKVQADGPAESAEDAFGLALHGGTILTGAAPAPSVALRIALSHVIRQPGVGFLPVLTAPVQFETSFTYLVVN